MASRKSRADRGHADATMYASIYLGMKQLMAGGGVALIGTQLVPLLATLFGS